MPNSDDLDKLVAAVIGTNKKLEDTHLVYNHIRTSVRKTQITLRIAIVGLLLDLTLSLAFGFILHDQSKLNDKVESNQASIHKAECDLNTVLIAADTPEQKERAPNPKLYDIWYDSIYATRTELGCRPVLINPRHHP